MSDRDINKSYVSPFDKFMFTFDLEHKLSLSQRKEVEKLQRIFKLRDDPQASNQMNGIWDGF